MGTHWSCLSINTREAKEFQLWLTRRFVQTIWSALIKVLESDPVVSNRSDTTGREAVLASTLKQTINRLRWSRAVDHSAKRRCS